jgi:transposase
MSSNFKQFDRNTLFLMPPSVQDWLPENHLARFIVEIASQLDLHAFKSAYAGRGSKAYHPEMLLALLFYGYATGVHSSRKIEEATYDSVAFRYIAANTHPDHDTIASFRKRFLEELKYLFVQILKIAHEMGILKIGKISLDGTKIKANASKHKSLSWPHALKLEKQLKDEIEELMRLAEKADAADSLNGMDIPEELSRRQDRISEITRARKEIERRAAQRYEKEKEAYEQKRSERKAKAELTGKKPRGQNPKPPRKGPRKTDQMNLTDGESRIMPQSGKGFKQAYNAQAGVDVETMLIVEEHISQCPNDKKEIPHALKGLSLLPKDIGKVDTILSDAGYFSESNVEACEAEHVKPYISIHRDYHNQPLKDRFSQPDPIPDDADPVARMRQRLSTSEGRKLYAKRKSTVEPVFGIIKHVMRFRQFLLRGLDAVRGEWDLVCIAWNLKRLHTLKA